MWYKKAAVVLQRLTYFFKEDVRVFSVHHSYFLLHLHSC